ncbi:hypothetical protein DIPPA_65974 [Diplonema papillatum]|nr:hypothetical protein DIPPA_65974 [Diplonema papillatum]
MARSGPTVLLVFHCDRGHFSPSLPLMQHLHLMGAKCELWTNALSEPWLPQNFTSFASVHYLQSDGVDFQRTVAAYKCGSTNGDTYSDGREYLVKSNSPVVSADPFQQCWKQADLDAFKLRLEDEDVTAVVTEGVWAKWAAKAAVDRGVPVQVLMPSYLDPFTAATGLPVWGFDKQCRVRNLQEDADLWPQDQDVVFAMATCLRGDVPPPPGRACVGAFLPLPGSDDAVGIHDAALEAWLDASSMPVTLVMLGSTSVLRAVSAWAETMLLKGCLAASPRVLVATPCVPDCPELVEAANNGRLRGQRILPQWALLGHPKVHCFVSHCGANSVHEALARAKPIVPLPLFDDQLYIAPRLEKLYGYTTKYAPSIVYPPLRKRLLRERPDSATARPICDAVQMALAVPKETLLALQEQVLAEKGAETTAAHVLSKQRSVSVVPLNVGG